MLGKNNIKNKKAKSKKENDKEIKVIIEFGKFYIYF
jgi:hypothetical protein